MGHLDFPGGRWAYDLRKWKLPYACDLKLRVSKKLKPSFGTFIVFKENGPAFLADEVSCFFSVL